MNPTLIASVAVAAGLAVSGVQPPTPPQTPIQPVATQPITPIPAPGPLDRFALSLQRLSPNDADAFFRLGEEVADAADSPERERLARELFAMAFWIDTREGSGPAAGDGSIAASACLALASLARLDGDRRWLAALASSLDPRHRPPGWVIGQEQAATAATAYRAATALGFARAGDGRQALYALDNPAVRTLLTKYDRLITDNAARGTLAAVEQEASRWPCRECSNQRIVKRQGRPGEFGLCPACDGRPGMKLAPSEWLAQIRLESLLLAGIHRSWGAQVAADLGQPLRDLDLRDLPGVLGVDVTRRTWRDGAWRP